MTLLQCRFTKREVELLRGGDRLVVFGPCFQTLALPAANLYLRVHYINISISIAPTN